MGTYNRMTDDVKPKVVHHIYRSEVDVIIRFVDRDEWQAYVQDDLPDSYVMTELNDKPNIIDARMSYTAAGANSHDIKRRLEKSMLQYTVSGTRRPRVCNCDDTVSNNEPCVTRKEKM